MNILLTNDDGINSNLLNLLYDILTVDHNVFILAPTNNMSSTSHKINVTGKFKINKIDNNKFHTLGTPADCVKIFTCGGVKEVGNIKIDLVISGINYGSNLGIDVYYSGTIAGAREAAIQGIPSIAVSLDCLIHNKNLGFWEVSGVKTDVIEYYIKNVINKIVLPKNPISTININIPNISIEELKGCMKTQLGVREYKQKVVHYEDGLIHFWQLPPRHIENDINIDSNIMSDLEAVKQSYISITELFILQQHLELKNIKSDFLYKSFMI